VVEDRTDGEGRVLLVRAADLDALVSLEENAMGWELGRPSLEEVFVALVRRPVVY
jgi:hypothetical protein